MNADKLLTEIAEEAQRTLKVMAQEYGDKVVSIALEQSNCVSMMQLLHGRISSNVHQHLSEIFSRLISMNLDALNIDPALTIKLADRILGYKKTLIEELEQKLSNPPSTKENPNG